MINFCWFHKPWKSRLCWIRNTWLPYPEWMEHVPYPPSYQIPNFFRRRWRIGLFGVFSTRVWGKSCCRGSLLQTISLLAYGKNPYLVWLLRLGIHIHTGAMVFSPRVRSPQGWNIPNHEWGDSDDDWDFQSEQDRWFSYFFSLRGCGECSTWRLDLWSWLIFWR